MYFLVWFIITAITELMKPDTRTNTSKKYSLNEIDLPTATEDRAQPLGFGTYQVAGNVTQYGDYLAKPVERSVSTGWFSSDTQTLGHKYYIGLGISLSVTTCDAVTEVRIGDHLVWSGNLPLSRNSITNLDVSASWSDQEGELVPDGFKGRFQFYNHDITKQVGGVLAPYVPLDTGYLAKLAGRTVPAYPNTCHAVFLGPSVEQIGLVGKPVSYPKYGFIGNNPNIQALLITLKRLPDLDAALGGTSRDFRHLTYPFVGSVANGDYTRAELDGWLAAQADIEGDANPAFVLLELLTTHAPGVGVRMNTHAINLESFFRAAETLKTEGNGVSFNWESTQGLDDLFDKIHRQCQSTSFINSRTQLAELRLIRTTDTPVMRFDDSNIIELTSFARVALEEAVNEVQVPFVDRQYGWKQRIETRFSPSGARSAGTAVAVTNEYIGVSRQALAQQLASRDIKPLASPLAMVSWTGTVEPGTVLRPHQLVELVHSPTGQLLRVRIKTVKFADWNSRLRVEIEGIEDVFRNGVAGVSTPPIDDTPTNPGPPESVTGAVLALAPYALHASADGYERLLYTAMDPGLSTTTFQMAVQDGRTAWSEFDTSRFMPAKKEPAINGFMVAAMAASTISPTFQMTLSDAAVEQWKKSTRGLVYMIVGSEWLACTSWTLTGNTLTAVSAERGIFDTVPGRFAAGTTVKLLLGYEIYSTPVRTFVTSGLELTDPRALTSAVARAESVGPGGVLDPVSAPSSEASWAYSSSAAASRAPKPLPPAYLRIGTSPGVAGALNTLDAVPSIARAATVTLNWANRNRLSQQTAGYYTAANDNESTVFLSYALDWETSPGVFSNNADQQNYTSLAAGAVTTSVNLSTVPTGARVIRLRVIMRRPHAVSSGNNFAVSTPVDVFWQLTT